MGSDAWPPLAYEEWKDTMYAIHMWTQVIGKIRLAMTPLMNHWWNSTLYVTPRGLTTSTIPSGDGAFAIDLDLIDHQLTIATDRARSAMPLGPMPVADFYRRLTSDLAAVGVRVPKLMPVPVEVAAPIPFHEDVEPRPYDRAQAERFARALLSASIVFERFRADFLGKASPVHFFFGGFDLAAARFSGRLAPKYAGGSAPNVHIHVMHESYFHELISAGFWFGSDDTPRTEFYSYSMPARDGISEGKVRPAAAGWVAERGEFLLAYDDVRTSADPAATLMEFLQSTYDVAAAVGGWDRATLERRPECDCADLPLVPRRTRWSVTPAPIALSASGRKSSIG
jgi:hypothetical protein